MLRIVLILWAITIAAGSVWMFDYTSRPGSTAVVPAAPPESIKSVTSKPKLLVFLHPNCPCGRATLAEIGRLSARNPGALDIRAFFYKPADQADDWVKTDIWQKALEIDEVNVLILGDEELERYGALTSGQVILYDAQDRPVFSGGVTRGRGHEGDSAGRESIERFLTTGMAGVAETPVFGCVITSGKPVIY